MLYCNMQGLPSYSRGSITLQGMQAVQPQCWLKVPRKVGQHPIPHSISNSCVGYCQKTQQNLDINQKHAMQLTCAHLCSEPITQSYHIRRGQIWGSFALCRPWIQVVKMVCHRFCKPFCVGAGLQQVDITQMGAAISKPAILASTPCPRSNSVMSSVEYFLINHRQHGIILFKLPRKSSTTLDHLIKIGEPQKVGLHFRRTIPHHVSQITVDCSVFELWCIADDWMEIPFFS